MRLGQYLDEVGISICEFSRRLGVCSATIYNILENKRDLRLSVAVRIVKETKGEVTYRELLPPSFQIRESNKRPKNKKANKKQANHQEKESGDNEKSEV